MKEKMHKLVEKTSHLALGTPPAPGTEPSIPHAAEVRESVAAFSPAIASYLAEIYKTLTASSSCKSEFLQKVQAESSDGKENADPLASLADFQAYMASPASAALRPPQKQDISAPITDYFISSSHNTYLTGNQVYSDAAASAYTNVRLSLFPESELVGCTEGYAFLPPLHMQSQRRSDWPPANLTIGPPWWLPMCRD